MTVRAKFVCTEKSVGPCTQEGGGEEAQVTFCAVAPSFKADGTNVIEENRIFGKWTPCAYLSMTIRNKTAFDQFEQGREYYVDFSPAEA